MGAGQELQWGLGATVGPGCYAVGLKKAAESRVPDTHPGTCEFSNGQLPESAVSTL